MRINKKIVILLLSLVAFSACTKKHESTSKIGEFDLIKTWERNALDWEDLGTVVGERLCSKKLNFCTKGQWARIDAPHQNFKRPWMSICLNDRTTFLNIEIPRYLDCINCNYSNLPCDENKIVRLFWYNEGRNEIYMSRDGEKIVVSILSYSETNVQSETIARRSWGDRMLKEVSFSDNKNNFAWYSCDKQGCALDWAGKRSEGGRIINSCRPGDNLEIVWDDSIPHLMTKFDAPPNEACLDSDGREMYPRNIH
jgi:hypothetical protein